MITGGCFCGRTTYQLKGLLERARSCHCSRCRTAFSGAGSAYTELSEGAEFTWLENEYLKLSSEDDLAIATRAPGTNAKARFIYTLRSTDQRHCIARA